jgi:hypothetical protein
MGMTNGTDDSKRMLSSLGELSRNVAPPRDLWPAIASQIATGDSAENPAGTQRSRYRPTGMQWAALAAVISALAVGMWLGRSVLPADEEALNRRTVQSQNQNQSPPGRPAIEGLPSPADPNASGSQPVISAAFVNDPRYTMQRAELIRGLEAKLNTLPPDTQHKVTSSLETIRTSIQQLQDALGRDPANALLQELLVNSYQDEMRVLTAVHEAGGASGGI